MSYAVENYSLEQLQSVTTSVAMASMGCGNPTAIANLAPGEVVLDLGSGAGLDCFLAAARVGAQGRIIGVDMTPEMVALARTNARNLRADNVEFRLGEMEHLPVDSGSVDVIISNCVINLAPDKGVVLAEAFRVLKPGGRLALSDIVLTGTPPPSLRDNLALWGSCVGGAEVVSEFVDKLNRAGFADVRVEALEAWQPRSASACCDTSDASLLEAVGGIVASAEIVARKPD